MTTVAVAPTASSWPGLEKFNLVQDYLEKNKLLITEINNNHEIRSSEGLARNVHLIRELNNNVAKVVALYKDLSGSLEQQQSTVHTAGEMGVLASGHYELMVEVRLLSIISHRIFGDCLGYPPAMAY
ncbi:hypothetical protein WJX79_002428 [Trebouxia sp. C0005]